MIDFMTAVAAKIPFVSVTTDDVLTASQVIGRLVGKPVQKYQEKVDPGTKYVYLDNEGIISAKTYAHFRAGDTTCVILNPSRPHMLVMDVGILPTPDSFYAEMLNEIVPDTTMSGMIATLRGLSPKGAEEVLKITMARTGQVTAHETRKTRQMMSSRHPGLSPIDTEYDFYEWPTELKAWFDLNDKYFTDLNVPQPLVPRGLLLNGSPGVGKSMAARVLAKHWDVPLFRLDIATSLNRWQGVAEANVERSMQIIEENAPCVWLLDEVEKMFGGQNDSGTMDRILSQFLWWLQTHKKRVLTVMTTNDMAVIPKELYRSERIDRVIQIEMMGLSEAKLFAQKVYAALMTEKVTMQRQKVLNTLIEAKNLPRLSHADVRVLVYEAVKEYGWLK